MEKANNPKTIKEVFRDYNSNNFELNGAKVVGINLNKRKNLFERKHFWRPALVYIFFL